MHLHSFVFRTIFDIHTYSSSDNTLYVIGTDADIKAFYSEFSAAHETQSFYPASYTHVTQWGVFAFLCLIIILLGFLTYYEICFLKKDAFIRVSLGEKLSYVFWKSVMLDCGFLLFTCITDYLILSHFVTLRSCIFPIAVYFCVSMLTIMLTSLPILRFDLKAVVHGTGISSKILSLNYILFTASTIACMLSISVFQAILEPSAKYFKAKSFFDAHADYCMCTLQHPTAMDATPTETMEMLEKNTLLNEKIYRNWYQQYQPVILAETSKNIIFANSNAAPYLETVLHGVNVQNTSDAITIFLPAELDDVNKQQFVNRALMQIESIEGKSFSYTYNVQYYDSPASVLILNASEGVSFFGYVENPCIILNHIPGNQLTSHMADTNRTGFVSSIIYNIPDENTFTELCVQNQLTGSITERTNIQEYFNHEWFAVKAGILGSGFLSLLFAGMELIVIWFIVKLEYQVNATTLAIQKVLGYSSIRKHSYFFALTLLSTSISTIASMLLCKQVLHFHCSQLLWMGAALSLLICIVISMQIRKVESENVSKILKGGAL